MGIQGVQLHQSVCPSHRNRQSHRGGQGESPSSHFIPFSSYPTPLFHPLPASHLALSFMLIGHMCVRSPGAHPKGAYDLSSSFLKYIHICICEIPVNLHFKFKLNFIPLPAFYTPAPVDLHWRVRESGRRLKEPKELSFVPSLFFALHLTCICRYILVNVLVIACIVFVILFASFLPPLPSDFFLSVSADGSAYVSVFFFR